MFENAYIVKWMANLFKTDATLQPLIGNRVYSQELPTGAVFPLIQFNYMAGSDVPGNGHKRLLTRPLFQVKTIIDGPINANAVTIANRIDELLQNTANQVFEGLAFSVRREQAVDYSERNAQNADKYYRHLGGLYRIDAHQV